MIDKIEEEAEKERRRNLPEYPESEDEWKEELKELKMKDKILFGLKWKNKNIS